MKVNHPSTIRGFNPQPEPPGQVSPKPPEANAARLGCWDPRSPGHISPGEIRDPRTWLPGNPTPEPLIPGTNEGVAYNALGDLWDAFTDWLGDKWDTIKDTANDLVQDFKDLLRNVVNWLEGPTA